MEKRKKNMFILCAASLLSAAFIINFSLFFYRSYQKELIRTEQDQLLTMARTVGQSLVSYIEQELTALDLYFEPGRSFMTDSHEQALYEAALDFLKKKGSVYDAMALYGPDGRLVFQEGEGNFHFSDLSLSEGDEALVCGKELSPKGWYQMFLSRSFLWQDSLYRIVYAMNLNELYEQIVAPVQIGQGGYSIVKDRELDIIMHHAPDQIGIDAIYDRSRLYPQLDLTDLFSWIALQQSQPEGQSVIHSYIWDDPDLPPQKRIVAYTTIQVPGEEWIVNSTLPLEELDQPLSHMMQRLIALSASFLMLLVAFVYFMTKGMDRAEAQRRQIAYLKEINEGMELLRRKDEELQRYHRMQSIGQMSSHIAHEFNNYLTPVMLYGEILENDDSISSENQELIRGIIDSVEQAKALSRKLLDFSRQDSYGALTEQDLVEETALAAQVVRHMAPKNITVQITLPDTSLFVRGNKGMMSHVLLNLCNNAFHAMEGKEGTLTICLEQKGPDKGLLSVSDTGCGISKEAMDKIFEPFYTTKRSGKGTGLGLSVVQNVMDSVNGQVQIESQEGVGTTFCLSFPLITPADHMPCSGKRYFHRLIVVDDDRTLLKCLKAAIASFSSQEADETGSSHCPHELHAEYYDHPAAVLSLLERDKNLCDILLTDYSMPSVNGLELAQMVRRLNPDIYVVLMSGSDNMEFEPYLKSGVIDRFIPKTELSGLLSRLLYPDSSL